MSRNLTEQVRVNECSLDVAVFGSGSGTNLEALIRAQRHSGVFNIKVVFTDRQCRCQEIAARENIPLIYLSYKRFCDEHKGSSDEIRHLYDQAIVDLLKPFSIDLIILAGYMRLISKPLLQNYRNKIINVHPADLSIINDDGSRRYVGADAIRMALDDGQKRTRSSVIIVDDGIDSGPIVTVGPWCVYTEGYPITSDKVSRHQDKQKCESDWPALIAAVNSIVEVENCKKGGRTCAD